MVYQLLLCNACLLLVNKIAWKQWLTVLFPRTRPNRPERYHMRIMAWPGPTIRKRTQSTISLALLSVSRAPSVIYHAARKWVRQSGYGCSCKESGALENVYVRWAVVTVSSTYGNSNYGADRNTPVRAAFMKSHAWPSICVVPTDNLLCLTDIKSPHSKCYAKPQSRFVPLWLVTFMYSYSYCLSLY